MVTRRQGLSRHHFCFIAYPEKLGERVKVVTKSDAPYPVLVDTPGLVSLNLPFVNQADGFPGEEFLEAGEARIQPLVRIRMLVVLGLRQFKKSTTASPKARTIILRVTRLPPRGPVGAPPLSGRLPSCFVRC